MRPPEFAFRGRVPVACLIAGSALLNVAAAGWAHAAGVACLTAFVVLAFAGIAVPALGGTSDA